MLPLLQLLLTFHAYNAHYSSAALPKKCSIFKLDSHERALYTCEKIPKILEFKSKYQKHTAIIENEDSVPNERVSCPLTLPRDPRTTNNNNKIRTKNIYLKKKKYMETLASYKNK